MRRSLLGIVLCLALPGFLPPGSSLHAQVDSGDLVPVATPQVTAIAVTPLVAQDGQSVAIGTFKIVRTGGTANTLYVTFQLGAKTTSGLGGLSQKIMALAILPGKSSAKIKIGFPLPDSKLPPLAFQKLKLITPTDGSYTVPNSKAVKIYVSY